MDTKTQYEQISWEQMRHVVRRFLTYARPYTAYYLVAFSGALIMGGAALIQALQLKNLTDKVWVGKNMDQLDTVCAILLATVAVKGIFSYLQGYMMAVASNGTVKVLRETVYRHLQNLPVPYHDRVRIGDLLARFLGDTGALTAVMTSGLSTLANDGVTIAVALTYMLYKSWSLTLLSLVASPVIAYFMTRFGTLIQASTARVQSGMSDLSSHVAETMANIRVVKCFTREDHEVERFAVKNEEAFVHSVKIGQLGATQNPVLEMLATLGVVAVIWYSGRGIVRGEYTLGDMMAFWLLMVGLMTPVNRLGQTISSLRTGAVCGLRVLEILDAPAEVDQHDGSTDLPAIQGAVAFEHVTFGYNAQEPVLNDVSFEVQPGELVAVVGPNGAGKTTIMNLLPRFYGPQSGTIRVDGMPLDDLKIQSLRRQCGIVPQDNMLLSGSIRDNLLYGKLDASEDEMVSAARIANAHDFISKLPQGYDTLLGERGVGLSGGQRQRLAIARAVLRNPRILILDEATSNLDAVSEREVQEALERLMAGRTTFVIAHRLQTIRRANRILVLSGGRIVEEGRHDDLMQKRGLYRSLYEAQRHERPDEEAA